MISEKEHKLLFLEGAIRNAKEEISEEIQSLLEGTDLKTGLATILKVIEDLNDSSIHFASYDTTNPEEEIEEDEEEIRFKFEVGDTVYVKDFYHIWAGYEEFAKEHGHPDAVISFEEKLSIRGISATILARGKNKKFSKLDAPLYIVKTPRNKFIVGEKGLEFF